MLTGLDRRSSIAWLFALALSSAALAACAPLARASRGHVFERTFSEHCLAEPCEGALKEPDGVAVNEESGRIYVVDKGANRVVRFSKEGVYEPEGELNGSGALPWEETEAGAGGQPGESGGSGSQPGERGKATGRFLEPEGIAIDNSCALGRLSEPKLTAKECEEKDPSNGDVYVVDAGFGHRVIDKYSPAGRYLGQLTAAGATSFAGRALDGVAADPEGGVWVYREEPMVIDRFSNAAANAFVAAIASELGFALPGFAVDAHGNFYARNLAKSDRISKLDPEGHTLIEELGKGAASAVSVEQASNDALVDNLKSVGVFDEKGREVERLGEGELSEGAGIGVNAGAGTLYVADAAAGAVAVFAPQQPQAPRIEGESLSNVTSQSAELGAEINPRSEAGEAPSEYQFQYGRCATAGQCAESGYEASIPVPGGRLEADFEVHSVSVHLQGLSPSTTYHFRAIARNARGEAQPGQERSFSTQSAGGQLTLADNRGWELVSPPDKQGSLIEPIKEFGVVQAAGSGRALTYYANAPTEAGPPGSSNEVQVLSRRGAGAWSSSDIAIPHAAAIGSSAGPGTEYRFFDGELEAAAVQPFGPFDPALSEEASEATAFVHDLSAGCASSCYRPLVTGKAGFANVPEGTSFGHDEECEANGEHAASEVCGPSFLEASEDLSHIVLGSRAELVAGAGEGQLYEWAGGKLARVSVLPGPAEAAPGANTARLGPRSGRGAVSADGSRVVWGTAQALYVRDSARGETVQVDEAGCGEGEGCTSGGGSFQAASADGSRILFTDQHKLSEDAGASEAKKEADLYECRLSLQGGKLGCELSDLTPSHGGEGAGVQGAILGASRDGSVSYFVARGVLSEGQNANRESAIAGQANLYVRQGGQTSFIATLAEGDQHDWNEAPGRQPTRVSASGRFLELMSEARLSGYDNRDTSSGKPAAEVYIYDAASKRLRCASCEPTGARPEAVEYKKLRPPEGLVGGPRDIWGESAPVAASVPGWATASSTGEKFPHQPRYLTDQGRLFFNSADGLVPQDSNGTQDVYEYEPAGVGSCSEGEARFVASAGGCVSLISSGSSAQESAFMDASESGDDVFFLTSARLSPLDTDAARDVYDAHVCTGELPCISFSSVQSPPCTTEASCKASPTPQPSIFGAPASATFAGPGNLAPVAAPAPKGQTRAQQLAKALKACRAKKGKKKRRSCEAKARRRYGAKAKAKKQAKHKRGGGK